MDPRRYFPRPLPEPLKGLDDLAVDLRWNWNHSADALWATVDAELWEGTGDPWLILETISDERLEALARDPAFLEQLHQQLARRQSYLVQPTWFSETHGAESPEGIAYLSMEFGLSEALPIYSGGLGILAGDHLKTASDLGVPIVGVGLLYQQGYFHQALGIDGEQLEFFPYNAPAMLPVRPVQGEDGGWLYVTLPLPSRTLRLRAWQAQVGRVNLYLLDSNDLLNGPGDRGITAELYGGGPELRLQQELVLGLGGWRLLQAIGLDCPACHLNEGHAAFAVVERARCFMERTGRPFWEALRATRAGNLFTTHTPVAAGFDCFSPRLMENYFGAYVESLGISLEEFLSLGQATPGEPFNMAYLAMQGSGRINGVSRLHGEVSRRIFQPLFPRWPWIEVPVGHVTNGVHMPSWDSAAADAIWTDTCGKGRWLGNLETLERDFRALSDERLWALRTAGRMELIKSLHARLAHQCTCSSDSREGAGECAAHVINPATLTLGFARRFTPYKRPDLLLHDRARLTQLLRNPERPVQLVIAGKAHPADQMGRQMIQEWVQFMREPAVGGRVVFVEDYDMALAAELVQGVDVWLNSPRRPWEASGTSGMKVLVNGGLNLSELDGWWAEAYEHDVGWALGDRQEHGDDPEWDAREADALFRVLEKEVVPTFYRRDSQGIPAEWVALMRESMARLTPQFSANRMVRQYVEEHYLPAAARFRQRAVEGGKLAGALEAWSRRLEASWPTLSFGKGSIVESAHHYQFRVEVHWGDMAPDDARVELYAEPQHRREPPELHPLEQGEPLADSPNSYLYSLDLPAHRPVSHYTLRIVPTHPEMAIPLESRHILWRA